MPGSRGTTTARPSCDWIPPLLKSSRDGTPFEKEGASCRFISKLVLYLLNKGERSLLKARIHRPIESAFSWMLYRNPSLFLSSTDKGSSNFLSFTRKVIQ
ncbi:hypothetical protein HAX54_009475 [Datura stramonium]|uniref:Uncharacterized protein n=1 Tax=Datura stramonium TaxID=4076 RepID=A0ABS8TFR7_DATST|nr:hypothetical protein [Datura stramonium]